MSRTSNKIIKGLAPALVVAAVVAPGAGAVPQDLRSPDAQDAGNIVQAQDLRSPDAGDAGRAASSPLPSPTSSNGSTGTDWGDVGIVSGGAMSLLLVGGLVLFTRSRGAARKSPVVSS